MDISTKVLLPSIGTTGEKETSLIRVDENGVVKSVIKRVFLSEKAGHMYTAKNGKWTITGEGYRHLNRYANLYEIKKDKIVVNNEEISNPYILFDSKGKKSKMIETVAVGGRSPSGEFHITEATIIMDVNEQFVKAMLYKIKTDKNCGHLKPSIAIDTKKDVAYAIDENVSIVLNLENAAVFDLYIKQLSDIEFSDRKVHTLAWRNAIKAHPAIGKSIINPIEKNGDKIAHVDIVMWTDNLTEEELEIIKKYKSNGKIEIDNVSDMNDDDPTEKDPDEELIEDLEPSQPEEQPQVDDKTEIVEFILGSEPIIGKEKLDSIISKFWDINNKKINEAPKLTLIAIQSELNKLIDTMEV